MNDDIRQRRRQAAWFCFQPHLSEDKLIQAIELLEERFQLEGMTPLISYITTVCNQFDIHKDIGKALCVKFFELMAHKRTELPQDPLPLVDEKRFANRQQLQQQTVAKTEEKDEKSNEESKTAFPIEDLPPHSVIFICFLRHIVKEAFADYTGLIKLLTQISEQDKKMAKELKTAIANWGQNSQNFRWVLPLNENKLAELTHLLYLCLCEVVGPVEADQVFHKAVAVCEQRPEAKLFSPSQLF